MRLVTDSALRERTRKALFSKICYVMNVTKVKINLADVMKAAATEK
jgi:hypothetical protein